jgi:cell division septation protein DedD
MRKVGSAGLGYGQVFVLIFGFLLASGLIFFLGFLVGKMRTEWQLAQEERVVRAPMPVPPTPKAATDVDLSFYQKLKEKAVQRLQETPVRSAPPPAPLGLGVSPTHVSARGAEKPTPRPTPIARAMRPPASSPEDEWADAGWTVQVNATTNPQQATDLARVLKAKGFDAYTVQAPMRGQTWYRVRVGRFSSREKAKELETRLKSSEGMENAYVTPQ